MTKKNNSLTNKMNTITCEHCHKAIIHPDLSGMTLVCPHCKKSVNGQYYLDFMRQKELNDKLSHKKSATVK